MTHEGLANRAHNCAQANRGIDASETYALLAIYHLLEERLPKPPPPGDLEDIGHNYTSFILERAAKEAARLHHPSVRVVNDEPWPDPSRGDAP